MREPGPERADFERLMRESYRLVYQVAYSVLGNAADAEEVAQDTFLTAYRKFDSLRDPERFRPWVTRASWRLALNRRRGAARAIGRDSEWVASRAASEDPESLASDREFEIRLRRQVELLRSSADRLPGPAALVSTGLLAWVVTHASKRGADIPRSCRGRPVWPQRFPGNRDIDGRTVVPCGRVGAR